MKMSLTKNWLALDYQTRADVLRKAAELILERGHCKYVRYDHNGRLCATGAMEFAYRFVRGAGDVRPLRMPGRLTDSVVNWNDDKRTTKNDVVKHLLRSARKYEMVEKST